MTSKQTNCIDTGSYASQNVLTNDIVYHLRKNTFASFSLLSFIVLALSLSPVFYLVESNAYHQDQTILGGLSWLVGQSILLLLLKHGVSKHLIVNLSMILAAIIINSTAWTSAGIVAIETPLLLLLPLIALSTSGHKAGVIWFFLIAANVLALAVATKLGVEFDLPSFDASWSMSAAIFLIVFMSCAFGLIRILQQENKKLQHALSELVVYHSVKGSHDGLTQLLNKESFEDMFDRKSTRMKFEQKNMTLLIVDLNKFKQINDNFGHLVGDEVLRGVAENLRQGLRAGDIAARIGGDEFAVLLEEVTHAEDIALRVAALKDSIKQAIETKVGPITVEAAIGAAVFARDGERFEDLYEAADLSMYQQKHQYDFQIID